MGNCSSENTNNDKNLDNKNPENNTTTSNDNKTDIPHPLSITTGPPTKIDDGQQPPGSPIKSSSRRTTPTTPVTAQPITNLPLGSVTTSTSQQTTTDNGVPTITTTPSRPVSAAYPVLFRTRSNASNQASDFNDPFGNPPANASSIIQQAAILKRAGSNQNMINHTRHGSDVKRLSRTTQHNLTHDHVRDVMTHVLGQKKDQDRAVCVPELLPGVLYCGVFDGHGRNGEIRAELATTELPKLLRLELERSLIAGETFTESVLHSALEKAYAKFHTELDELYQQTVLQPAVEEKAKQLRKETSQRLSTQSNQSLASKSGDAILDSLIAEAGGGGGGSTTTSTSINTDLELRDMAPSVVAAAPEPFPGDEIEVTLRMPQDGGTTATSVIVAGDLIVVGWVGDSRAVLSRRIAKKKNLLSRFSSRLKIATVTEDHNVQNHLQAEMDRVTDQGGEIYGKHIAANAVEGMLALTRSLGDTPFHRTGLVTSKPGLITVPITDDSVDPLLFLLVASDGLWDYFDNTSAIKYVYKRLKKEKYADERDPTRRNAILTDTARALEDEAIRKAAERRGHTDDITILIMTFNKGWSLEENDVTQSQTLTPNF
jgi:serine/threonine protein phosphatase PrpC